MTECAGGDDELMEAEDSDEGSSNALERKRASRKGAASKKKAKSRSCHLYCQCCTVLACSSKSSSKLKLHEGSGILDVGTCERALCVASRNM